MEDLAETITCGFSSLPKEILFKILSQMYHGSLLSCRLVNQDWCAVSSAILQSSPYVTVYLSYNPTLKGKRSPASFIECFQESMKFRHALPSVNFTINLRDATVSEYQGMEPFFALTKPPNIRCGSGSALVIKCLRFDYIFPCQTTMNILENFIFEATPQLEILALHFDLQTGKPYQDQSPSQERKLLSLQVLQQCLIVEVGQVNFLKKLLRAAPNIRRIEGTTVSGFAGVPYMVSPEYLESLIDAKKLHIVDRCVFTLTEELVGSGLVDREKLSGFQPKLLYLNFAQDIHRRLDQPYWKENPEQFRAGTQEALWSVKDSVEELHTGDNLSLVDSKRMPQLSRLRRLHWRVLPYNCSIFPPGIREKTDVFPRLEKIWLSHPELRDSDKLFPDLSHVPVIPSVHSVDIKTDSDKFDGNYLEFMGLMCPNLRRLKLHFFCYKDEINIDFNRIGPIIWTNMRKLKMLGFYHLPRSDAEFREHFEAGFTGFSLETVRQLHTTAPEDRPGVEEVEHLRINPSIIQLTGLEKLVISLLYINQALEIPLSFKYAFDLMPGLTVKI